MSRFLIRRIKITVTGRVQGVWFRASAQAEADRIGIVGVVRNQLDGSVLIEAQGNEQQLQSLMEWCWKGPQFAKVSEVLVDEVDELGEYGGFDIER